MVTHANSLSHPQTSCGRRPRTTATISRPRNSSTRCPAPNWTSPSTTSATASRSRTRTPAQHVQYSWTSSDNNTTSCTIFPKCSTRPPSRPAASRNPRLHTCGGVASATALSTTSNNWPRNTRRSRSTPPWQRATIPSSSKLVREPKPTNVADPTTDQKT